MCSSAIASSAAVVTPGATAPRSSSRVRPTTRPASRILAICASVFSSIISSCLRRSPMPCPPTFSCSLMLSSASMASIPRSSDPRHPARSTISSLDAQQLPRCSTSPFQPPRDQVNVPLTKSPCVCPVAPASGYVLARPRSSTPRARRGRAMHPAVLGHPSKDLVNGTLTAEAHQGVDRPLRNVLDRPCRVQSDEDALVGIKVDQRRCLLGVDLEPMPNGLLPVVVTLEQFTPALVASPLPGGRVEVCVPNTAADTTGPAPGQPADNLVIIDDELQDDVELPAHVVEHLVKCLRLGESARKAVQQEAVPGVAFGQPIPDHGDRDGVRHQIASVHIGLGLPPELGPLTHVHAEDVSCRNLGDRQVGGDELGLGPLPRSRWPEEDDAHYRKKPS